MAWFDEAVFYQIYPLGLVGAPWSNDYGPIQHRMQKMLPWIRHIKELNCDCIYLGPCFQSGSHGYDTTDYKTLDCRLGDNQDLVDFVAAAHEAGLRVIFDGVFNHTGRDFFAFQDILAHRESSQYTSWYQGLHFQGDNSYHDGFCYHSWHGYDLLPQLNQRNPEVLSYIQDVIRYWVETFDVDGIRLDAAEDMDLDFLRGLRRVANEVKPDFWLMGEVIHGDYTRFVQPDILHAVTNYQLHKPIYSAHNSHNYFELAYNVKRIYDLAGQNPLGIRLYNFLDNHDVSRIASLLENPAHLLPCYILDYTLPGVPSIYYGSEFAIPGRKEDGDEGLRPELHLSDYEGRDLPLTQVIRRLGNIRHAAHSLSYGAYQEQLLTNRQYAFSRISDGGNPGGRSVAIIMVNNDDNPYCFDVDNCGENDFVGGLWGQKIQAENGRLRVEIPGNSGEIWVSSTTDSMNATDQPAEKLPDVQMITDSMNVTNQPAEELLDLQMITDSIESTLEQEAVGQANPSPAPVTIRDLPYEELTVEELQQVILDKMAKNGPVTEDMKRTVYENIWHDSLVNWAKSFR